MRRDRAAEGLLGRPWRLAAVVALTLAFPIIVVSASSVTEAQRRFESGSKAETLEVALAIADGLGVRVGRLREFTAVAANHPDIREAIKERDLDELEQITLLTLRPFLGGTGEGSNEVSRILIADAAGIVLWPRPAATVGRPVPQLDGTAFFIATREAGNRLAVATATTVLVSDLEVLQGVPSVFVSAPVIHGLDPFVGALILEVRTSDLAASLRSAGVSDVYLVDRRGHVITRAMDPMENHPDLSGNGAVASALAGRYGAAKGPVPLSNSEGVTGTAPVAGTDWSVLAVRETGVVEAELFAAQTQQRVGAFGLAAVLVLGSLLIGVVSSRSIRRRDALALALKEQAATAEILRLITRSREDATPVLGGVIRRAVELSGSDNGSVMRLEDGAWRHVAMAGEFRDRERYGRPTIEVSPNPARGTAIGRVLQEKRTVHVVDTLSDPDYDISLRSSIEAVRTILAVPLFREQEVIGVIVLRRRTVAPFSPRQIRLIETFATQVSLAIENVRRSDETMRLLEQVQLKSRELESASRHKSEFLANMSHELRTPLNAIIGFSEVLLAKMAGDLNDQQRDYIEDIRSSGEHQLALINDVLDLSKVEAGKMELKVEPFELAAAVEQALALVRERASRQQISISAEVPAELGRIDGDERKVTQVLLNLLSNAVKFTPAGGWIGVVAKRVDGEAHVSVRDTGPGIAPEDHDRIFEEFRQGGDRSGRVHEGTGLGLALSKRFIELHRGRIWLESEVGKGSTFTFAIPIARLSEASGSVSIETS